MKIVRVTYQVKPEFSEQNQRNIEAVMSEIKGLNNGNIKYASYLEEDGVSFMHFAQYPDEATSQIVTGLESFKKFQAELKGSGLVSPPNAKNLSLVASGYEIFNS